MLCLPLALRKSINSTETKILPITRQSKKLYYFSYLRNLINNLKKTWARINEVMNRNKLKSIISFNYLPAIIYQEDSSDSLKKKLCQWYILLQFLSRRIEDVSDAASFFLDDKLFAIKLTCAWRLIDFCTWGCDFPQGSLRKRVKARRNLTNETEQSVYMYIV